MSRRSNQDKVNAMILKKNNMPTTSVPVSQCNRFQNNPLGPSFLAHGSLKRGKGIPYLLE